MKVGVIGVQGSVDEHMAMVKALGVDAFKIRRVSELREADAIIIPGGESTSISRLFVNENDNNGDSEFIREFLDKSRSVPVMGTCAGLILLAKEIRDARVETSVVRGLGLLNISVIRNYYGRQKHSFEDDVRLVFSNIPFPGVFIRAPFIEKIYAGESIAFLGDYPVGVQEGHIIGLTFHPELTDNTTIHRYFLSLAKK